MMNMKKYEAPKLEVVTFENEDIICTSATASFNIEAKRHLTSIEAADTDFFK